MRFLFYLRVRVRESELIIHYNAIILACLPGRSFSIQSLDLQNIPFLEAS